MSDRREAGAAPEETGTPTMVVGTLVGGLAAYLFHAWGGRELGPEAFAPIGVMWTVAFIAVAVLYLPLEQWVTREVTSRRNPLWGGWGWLAAVMGTAILAAGLATGSTLAALSGPTGVHVAQMLVLVLGYGCFWTGKGMLQGRGRYGRVGWMLCAEGVVRLAGAGLVLSSGGGAVGLGWAMAAAPWVVLLFASGTRSRAEGPAAAGGVFVAPYALGSIAAHILVAGAPLAVTYMGGAAREVSLVFVVFVLFRAPLTLMYSLQGRILPPLVRMVGRGEDEALRSLAKKLWAGSVGLALPAAAAGYLAGPAVVELLMGPEFAPAARVAALVASGTVMAAGVQLVAQTLVAGSRTASLAAAWVTGLAAAALVTGLGGWGPVVSVAAGFCAGEATVLMVVGRMALSRSAAPGAGHAGG